MVDHLKKYLDALHLQGAKISTDAQDHIKHKKGTTKESFDKLKFCLFNYEYLLVSTFRLDAKFFVVTKSKADYRMCICRRGALDSNFIGLYSSPD